jgi:hypothetical protein
MKEAEKKYDDIALSVPRILMPAPDTDMTKWAVIACDQYTSEPEYWQEVESYIGSAPSTYNLIFPEVYLEEPDRAERIASIQRAMDEYLHQELLQEHGPALFLIHRTTPDSPPRWGLIAALDLEQYDYSRDTTSLIRPTEGTIEERIPPRKKIREHAAIELPHIMVLIDDMGKNVIEPLARNAESYEKVYDFDLMKNGGHLTGYKVDDDESIRGVVKALRDLADPQEFSKRHGTDEVLLYAMGDGNHSFATAKAVWEDIKRSHSDDPDLMNHPARWALVEIENIYDDGLVFEPIHRVVFGGEFEGFRKELETISSVDFAECGTVDEVMKAVESSPDGHRIGYADSDRIGFFTVHEPNSTIAAGTAQNAIDSYLASRNGSSVDFIHGQESTTSIGRREGNFAVFLPGLDKKDFFRTVVHDGALPKKTFSMGEAHEKRYYVEARKIKR